MYVYICIPIPVAEQFALVQINSNNQSEDLIVSLFKLCAGTRKSSTIFSSKHVY
jgi:hypothetical protein